MGITDPYMLRRLYHSKQVPPVGFNRTYDSNPKVDRLIDLASIARTDESSRVGGCFWMEIVAPRVPLDAQRRHSASYRLTLHDPTGRRVFGIDNAHAQLEPAHRFVQDDRQHDAGILRKPATRG